MVRRDGRGSGERLRRLGVELVLVAGAVAVNLIVRWWTLDERDTAVRNAERLVSLQERLGIDWERDIQTVVLTVPWLSRACAWFYVWGYLPVVLGALVWSFVRHPQSYLFLRNALLTSGVVGVAVYALYPCAPPRLMGLGYVDTVAADDRVLNAAARPVGMANEIAALPSFHVGWLVLVSVAVFATTRSTLVRAWCVVHPLAMSFVVVATGNHWLLDVPAGLALAAFGLVAVAVVGGGGARAAARLGRGAAGVSDEECGTRADAYRERCAARPT